MSRIFEKSSYKVVLFVIGSLVLGWIGLMIIQKNSRRASKFDDYKLIDSSVRFRRDRISERSQNSGLSFQDRIRSAVDQASYRAVLEDLSSYDNSPIDLYQDLFRRWFEKDRSEALAAAQGIVDESLRMLCLIEGIVAYSDKPETISFMYEDLLSDRHKRNSFAAKSCELLAARSPEVALRLIKTTFRENYRDSVSGLFRGFANEDWTSFDDVMSLSKRLEGGKAIEYALRAAIAAAPEKITLKDFEEMKTVTNNALVSEEGYKMAARNALKNEGVTKFLETVDGQEIPVGARRSVLRLTIDKLQEKASFDETVKNLESSPISNMKDFEKEVGLALLSSGSLEHAKQYAARLTASGISSGNVANLVASELVRVDANEAARWIGSLPKGKIRDAALDPLLSYLKQHDEIDSLEAWGKLKSRAKNLDPLEQQ